MPKGNLVVHLSDMSGDLVRGRVDIDLRRVQGSPGAGGENMIGSRQRPGRRPHDYRHRLPDRPGHDVRGAGVHAASQEVRLLSAHSGRPRQRRQRRRGVLGEARRRGRDSGSRAGQPAAHGPGDAGAGHDDRGQARGQRPRRHVGSRAVPADEPAAEGLLPQHREESQRCHDGGRLPAGVSRPADRPAGPAVCPGRRRAARRAARRADVQVGARCAPRRRRPGSRRRSRASSRKTRTRTCR